MDQDQNNGFLKSSFQEQGISTEQYEEIVRAEEEKYTSIIENYKSVFHQFSRKFYNFLFYRNLADLLLFVQFFHQTNNIS